MRTVIFLSALFIGSAINRSYEMSDWEAKFFAFLIVMFAAMDLIEFVRGLLK